MQDVRLFGAIEIFPHEEIDGAQIYNGGSRVGTFDLQRLDEWCGTTWWMTQPNLLLALKNFGESNGNFEIRFGAAMKKLERNTAWVQENGETREIHAKSLAAVPAMPATIAVPA